MNIEYTLEIINLYWNVCLIYKINNDESWIEQKKIEKSASSRTFQMSE